MYSHNEDKIGARVVVGSFIFSTIGLFLVASFIAYICCLADLSRVVHSAKDVYYKVDEIATSIKEVDSFKPVESGYFISFLDGSSTILSNGKFDIQKGDTNRLERRSFLQKGYTARRVQHLWISLEGESPVATDKQYIEKVILYVKED